MFLLRSASAHFIVRQSVCILYMTGRRGEGALFVFLSFCVTVRSGTHTHVSTGIWKKH